MNFVLKALIPPQVPFLSDLIMRWAESTGFDISAQPSEQALTHAVKEAFELAIGMRSSPPPAALPRASREEMDSVAAAYDEPNPASNPTPSPTLNPAPNPTLSPSSVDGVTSGVAALSVIIPPGPGNRPLVSLACGVSSADGTLHDWIPESPMDQRSDTLGASSRAASPISRGEGSFSGAPAVRTSQQARASKCSILGGLQRDARDMFILAFKRQQLV